MLTERLKSPEEFFKIYQASTDHDGVIADTRGLVVEEFNTRFGTEYKVTEIRDWSTITYWALKEGLSEEDAKKVDDELWLSPDVLIKAKPVEGAKEFTRWFHERGIFLPIITSRNPDLIDATIAWYEREMPWVSIGQIFQRQNREMDGFIFKTYIINQLGIDIHFEDSPHQAQDLLNYTNAQIVLLTNMSYLDNYKSSNLTRISGIDGGMPTMKQVNKMFLSLDSP